MQGGRQGKQTKGIICLETDRWEGTKDQSSVEPVLRLLERLNDYRVPYMHKRLATRKEMQYSLERYLQPTFKTHPILYLSFHGYPSCKGEQSGLWLGERKLPLENLAEMMEKRCANRIVYFGSCGTMDTDGRRLNTFLQTTKASAVCGYMEDVDWLESAAFDLLFLGKVQDMTFRYRKGLEQFDKFHKSLRETAPRLYRNLGFRMRVRSD